MPPSSRRLKLLGRTNCVGREGTLKVNVAIKVRFVSWLFVGGEISLDIS